MFSAETGGARMLGPAVTSPFRWPRMETFTIEWIGTYHIDGLCLHSSSADLKFQIFLASFRKTVSTQIGCYGFRHSGAGDFLHSGREDSQSRRIRKITPHRQRTGRSTDS